MSITTYTDTETYTLLDDALEQLARHRELSLASDTGLLSVLGSLALQLNSMIEQAIAETDLGHQVTLADIADLLDISTNEAHHRYAANDQPF